MVGGFLLCFISINTFSLILLNVLNTFSILPKDYVQHVTKVKYFRARLPRKSLRMVFAISMPFLNFKMTILIHFSCLPALSMVNIKLIQSTRFHLANDSYVFQFSSFLNCFLQNWKCAPCTYNIHISHMCHFFALHPKNKISIFPIYHAIVSLFLFWFFHGVVVKLNFVVFNSLLWTSKK